MDLSIWISLVSLAISVVAASFSYMQAMSARAQARAAHGDLQPTFYVETNNAPISELDGKYARAKFILTINNFNRRALRIIRVHTTPEDNTYTTEVAHNSEARGSSFKIEDILLPGVSPGSERPSTQSLTFLLKQVRPNLSPRAVKIKVHIWWMYADATSAETVELIDYVPVPDPVF